MMSVPSSGHNAVCINIFVVRVRNVLVQCTIQYHYVSSCVTLQHHSSPFCIIDVWPCWFLVFFGMIDRFLLPLPRWKFGRRCSDAPLMESGLDSLSAVDFRNQAPGPWVKDTQKQWQYTAIFCHPGKRAKIHETNLGRWVWRWKK